MRSSLGGFSVRSRLRIGAAVAFFLVASASFPVQVTPEPSPIQAQVAASNVVQIDATAAYYAARSNLSEVGMGPTARDIRVSGDSQLTAIVDTGVDPATFTVRDQDGAPRLLEIMDLTNEGVATVLGQYQAENGYIHLGETTINLGPVRGQSGTYLVGTLPRTIVSRMAGYREVYFVVGDPVTKGVYNTVWIDTDSDLSLADETPLTRYLNSREYTRIALSEEQTVSIVVSDILENGSTIVFGFDLNGHGTGLASIACGTGSYRGVAPDAKVLSIKVIGSDGNGDWSTILRGIEAAISRRAGVILVGSAPRQEVPDAEWADLLERLHAQGINLVMPAGNNGPGAGTITLDSSGETLVLVSGYYPVEAANALLGTTFSQDTWYPYSSCGPDPKGNRGLSVMAPAVAAVPRPGDEPGTKFVLMEGTSVSAAYATGAVALLRDSVEGRISSQTASAVVRSLKEAATPIQGLLPVEQGAGRMDVQKALEFLQSAPGQTRLILVRKWDGYADSNGVWVKENTPAAMPLWVDSFSPVARRVELSTDVEWLRPESRYLELLPVSQRSTQIYGPTNMAPGFYSGEVVADDPATLGTDDSLPVSVSIPQRFSLDGNLSFQVSVDENTRVSRQFIRVPESVESMSISVTSPSQGIKYSIYSPGGFLVREGITDILAPTRIGLPEAGLWQVCVYYTGSLDIDPAEVKVEGTLDGLFISDLGSTDESHYMLVHSDEAGVELTFAANDGALEWRDRRSFAQPVNRSMQLALPAIDESVGAISIRSGAITGSYLRVYLYRFDDLSGRWTEVGRSMTASNGVGDLHLPNPAPGRYIVYLEAYGVKPIVYVELDAVVLQKDVKAVDTRSGSVRQGSATLQISPRKDQGEPGLIVARRQSDSTVIGIIERALVIPEEIPIVQILGGDQVKTIRAWIGEGMVPLDAMVTVGSAAYQLSDGRVTAPVPHGVYAGVITPDGFRLLIPQSNE